MSHLESIPEVPASYDYNYKYFNDEVSGWVLKLANQKNEDFERIFVNETEAGCAVGSVAAPPEMA